MDGRGICGTRGQLIMFLTSLRLALPCQLVRVRRCDKLLQRTMSSFAEWVLLGLYPVSFTYITKFLECRSNYHRSPTNQRRATTKTKGPGPTRPPPNTDNTNLLTHSNTRHTPQRPCLQHRCWSSPITTPTPSRARPRTRPNHNSSVNHNHSRRRASSRTPPSPPSHRRKAQLPLPAHTMPPLQPPLPAGGSTLEWTRLSVARTRAASTRATRA